MVGGPNKPNKKAKNVLCTDDRCPSTHKGSLPKHTLLAVSPARFTAFSFRLLVQPRHLVDAPAGTWRTRLSPSFQKKEPPRVDARERQIVVEKTERLKVQPHELGFLSSEMGEN